MPASVGRAGPQASLARTAAAVPYELAALTHSLASADGSGDEIEPVIADLPDLEKWPRYLRAEGPLYGLVQFSPYVGQFGTPADAKRADSGMGYGLTVGYRVPFSGASALGFEFIYESSGHRNEASDVDARATRIVAGARLSLKMDEKIVPFAVAGLGSYSLKFDGLDSEYDLSGLGVMIGGGINVSPSPRFSFRSELALHLWDAAEEGSGHGGMAETLALALGAAFSF